MNNKFDELAKAMAQSVTRRQALKKVRRRPSRHGAGLLRTGQPGGGRALREVRPQMQQPRGVLFWVLQLLLH